MFVHYEKGKNRFPIKIWLAERNDIDENCLEQAINLSNLPFIHKWVSLMPDTHMGKGMPIGGVIACDNVVIPNAVGVDIGCGMAFTETNIPAQLLKDTMTGSGSLIHTIVGNILRSVPTGYAHFKSKQESAVIDKAFEEIERYKKDEELIPQIEDGYFQVGTLGGGNHFIELQQDENGNTCIMLHSGSRHFGNQIGQHFNAIARELNARWFSDVPSKYNLPFLPADSDEGQRYIEYMQLAMNFAYENRARMLSTVKRIVSEMVEKHLGLTVEYTNEINCHHNYASLETHFDKQVWVHRKGAVKAENGELTIIPGAMGSYSYIAMGLGNPDSFRSCSHGAGRLYSRTSAVNEFSVEKVMVDLKNQGVVLGKHNKSDVAEECRFAYKDIDTVMANEKDLVTPVKKMFTIGVVKG